MSCSQSSKLSCSVLGRTGHWHELDSHAQVPDRGVPERAVEVATALRLGATPDAGPRSTCALRKGNDGDMCEQSLAVSLFLLQVWES